MLTECINSGTRLGGSCIKLLPIPPADNVLPYWVSPALELAGIIFAAVVAFGVAKMTARSETRRIREEREENAINRALSAALKIARYAESVKLYEFHLLEEFKQAEKDNPAAEPFERVRAVRGTEYILEAVTTDETRFLIELKRLGLIADIHTLHRNALNLRQLFELYDEKHSNLEQWIKSVPKTHSFLRNEFTVSGIPDDNLPDFNLHAAELNILVSQIIELIDTSLRI